MTPTCAGLIALILSLGIATPKMESFIDAPKIQKRPKNPAPTDPSIVNLSLEIAALQLVHRFDMTQPQLVKLAKLAAECAPKNDQRKPTKPNDKLLKLLKDLHQELIDDSNNDLIEQLEEDLTLLIDQEKIEIDDRINLTPLARQRAHEMVRTLRPTQIVDFFNASGTEVPDPLETLTSAIEQSSQLKDAEWKPIAEQIVVELQWQLGGLDPAKTSDVESKVRKFLTSIRRLTPKELEAQKSALQDEADKIVSATLPTAMLTHLVEYSIAELLSNPRATAALALRLENDLPKPRTVPDKN